MTNVSVTFTYLDRRVKLLRLSFSVQITRLDKDSYVHRVTDRGVNTPPLTQLQLTRLVKNFRSCSMTDR